MKYFMNIKAMKILDAEHSCVKLMAEPTLTGASNGPQAPFSLKSNLFDLHHDSFDRKMEVKNNEIFVAL